MAAEVAEIYLSVPVWEAKSLNKKKEIFSGFHGAKMRLDKGTFRRWSMPTPTQNKYKLPANSSLHSHTLCKVSRLVDRAAPFECGMVCQKLHRNDLKHRHEKVGRIGYGYIAAFG